MSAIRLDKLLAETGEGTRSEVKNMIRKGRVLINGESCRKPEQKVDIEKDIILLDGRQICCEKFEYYMLNKPEGCVTATSDPMHRTVMDFIPSKRSGLFPVGRLDKDTRGLLLVTNDGELAHRLLAPGRHVDKCYYAKIDGAVTEEDVQKFSEGLDIGEEKKTMPAVLRILNSAEVSEVEVTIQEGKFHQVKRMFHAVGKEVLYLERRSMGALTLDTRLKPGECRRLTKEETECLRQKD